MMCPRQIKRYALPTPDCKSMVNTVLQEIAGEKAGIFKAHVPAYTVPQLPEAMQALEVRTAGKRWVESHGLRLASVLPLKLCLGEHGRRQPVEWGSPWRWRDRSARTATQLSGRCRWSLQAHIRRRMHR